MKTLEPSLATEVKRESIIIASLLHDVCKSDIYKRSVKKRKNALGQWEDTEGYKVTYKNFPMGHGEKSLVMILLGGIDLYDDEMLAIRWHMGAWGLNQNSFEDVRSFDTAQKLYPLVPIIHAADGMAANVMERTAAAITATAPTCPMASLANPIRRGNTVPPKRPITISPLTSFLCSGTEMRACEKTMEKMLELPYPTRAIAA